MKQRIKLRSIIQQVRGVSYKPIDIKAAGDPDAIALLRANNIQDDGLNFEDLIFIDKKKVRSNQMILKGDILICTSSGSKNLVGKAVIADRDLPCTFGAFCKIVRVKAMDAAFVGHFFQSPRYRREISKASAGANINNIRNEHIDDMEILVYSDAEQRRIAAVLDNVSDLITKHRQQLDKLDELVKSRFIEMFGDVPEEEKVTIAEICKIITDGTHQPPKFTNTGIPFLFVSNIITNDICYDAEKFISEETYAELIKRTPIEIGDILLSTVGSYGHPAIVKTDRRFCFQRHIAYLKPKSDMVKSEYLRGAILSDNVQRQIDERVKGIAQKTLNLSEIRKIRLPLPPMKLQEKFTTFVAQTDKSKLAIKQSLEKLETLKKSLMQQYFG